MRRIVRNVRALHNPVSLSGVGGLAVVRGIAYIATGTDTLPLNGYGNTPNMHALGLTLIGIVWLCSGLFLWAGMAIRRLFIVAVAFMVGMYSTWVVIHAVDLFTSPDWDSIVGLAVYLLLVPVTITLAAIELAPPGEPSTQEVVET